jgi:hypothetical protein
MPCPLVAKYSRRQSQQPQPLHSDPSPSTIQLQLAEPLPQPPPGMWGIRSSSECEHLAVSLTVGERVSVILNDKPLQAPSLDAVLEGDVQVISLSSAAHLQARTPPPADVVLWPSQGDSDTNISTVQSVAGCQEKPHINGQK